MQNNNLVGTIPTNITQLTSLQQIELSGNAIAGSLPSEIGSLSNLEYLYMIGNKLSGSLPSSFYSLTKLTKLILQNNTLSGSVSPSISNFANLTFLDLSSNKFTGAIPTTLWNLTQLTNLYLDHNSFSGGISSLVSNLINLSYLYLGSNSLSGTVPAGIWEMSRLIELSIGSNGKLQGTLPDLSALTSLQLLDLDSTEMTGTLPDSLWTLGQLRNINLAGTQFSGTISDNIQSLKLLNSLSLLSLQTSRSSEKFSGTIPSALWELNDLQFIILDYNEFTGEIPPQISNLASLQKFHIDSNYFTGTIPSELWTLKNMTDLDISNNQLIGTLSDSISNLNQLTALRLGGNYLTGDVPVWFNQTLPGFLSKTTLLGNMWLCPVPTVAREWGASCVVPTISSIDPPYSATTGGSVLWLTGKYFPMGVELECSFSNGMNSTTSPVLSVALPSNGKVGGVQQINCSIPMFVVGEANVSIVYEGNVVSNEQQLLFFETPDVYSVSPNTGRQQGGTPVVVTGENFAPTDHWNLLWCMFGSTTTPGKYVNSTAVNCTSPLHAPFMNVTLQISNDNGTNWSPSSAFFYFYPDCNCSNCNNNGHCNTTVIPAQCDCNSSFTGAACDECLPSFYGPSCEPCPLCERGICNDLMNGTGRCECPFGWSGETCSSMWEMIVFPALIAVLLLVILFFVVRRWRASKVNDEEQHLLDQVS
eukprot:TRINITY_DN1378_c0_g2_i2.p1 TRINITY_DN1378_c0_g2~~TRINITY_DN1378_c0_g2_i2.p1  ORF type:complete len:703 (-),score=86.91 TRINITY_DN1378_c0_g2_i2:78-2186(-)